MKAAPTLHSASLAIFIGTLILSILFYLLLYLMNLSKPIYIRMLFSIISFSGSTFAFYCFSILLGTQFHLPGKIGLVIVCIHFALLLFTIWSNASFLANNWLFLEISIAIILLAAIAAWFYTRYANP